MTAQRFAVFSDLHGNRHALQAVLQVIDKDGPFDALVAAGDLCLGGSDPAGCIDLLRANQVQAIYGNTEEYILSPENIPSDELHQKMWQQILPGVMWVREQLSTVQLNWLEALTFEKRFSPTDNPAEDLLVVHANPRNVELMILPGPTEQLRLWGEIRQPDDDPLLREVLQGVSAQVVAFGHFHYTSIRRWNALTLVNTGQCSLPGTDHDPRARYTIFEWTKSQWEIQQRWVSYPYEKEVAALKASNLPNKENFLHYFDKIV